MRFASPDGKTSIEPRTERGLCVRVESETAERPPIAHDSPLHFLAVTNGGRDAIVVSGNGKHRLSTYRWLGTQWVPDSCTPVGVISASEWQTDGVLLLRSPDGDRRYIRDGGGRWSWCPA